MDSYDLQRWCFYDGPTASRYARYARRDVEFIQILSVAQSDSLHSAEKNDCVLKPVAEYVVDGAPST